MGVLRAVAGLSLLSTGCAQLFGIEETSTGGVIADAGADANPMVVSVEVQRISVGPTAARTMYDVSAYPANFLVADSSAAGFTRVTATAAGSTWSAPIETGTPQMEITLGLDIPDVFRRLYTFGQRNLKVLYGVYEQPNAPVAPVNGSLNVSLTVPTLTAANESFQLYSLGAWANHGLTAVTDYAQGVAGFTVAVPYNATTWGSISGRPLTKITAQDQVVALRYVGAQLTAAGLFPPFDQTDTVTAISASMTSLTAAPMDVHVSPSNINARLAMPTPKGTALAMNWSVNAAPGWEIANGTGPQLQAGGVLVTDSGALTLPFGNPFTSKGWKSVFTWATSNSRTFAVPQLMSLTGTFYCGINQIAEVVPGLTLDTPAGIPVLVSINAMPLSTDGQTLAIDLTKPVTLSMVADKTDPLFYQFNIYELRVNMAGTALETHVAYVALTTSTSVTIPPDALTKGKTYLIRAHTIKGGYPSFGAGNLWDRSIPYSVGYLDAGIFTIS